MTVLDAAAVALRVGAVSIGITAGATAGAIGTASALSGEKMMCRVLPETQPASETGRSRRRRLVWSGRVSCGGRAKIGHGIDLSCPHCGAAVRCELYRVADCRGRWGLWVLQTRMFQWNSALQPRYRLICGTTRPKTPIMLRASRMSAFGGKADITRLAAC